jgi:hypothetical protein
LLLIACHRAAPPNTAPIAHTVLAANAPGPDTIPCERAVLVKATSDQGGVREERAWLNEHYPSHSAYGQSLAMKGSRAFDILEFNSADGHAVSVCFDITASFGHF